MKVNIQTMNGLRQVQLKEKPFEVKGIWLFAEKDFDDGYVISEWQTGFKFTYVKYKKNIIPKINSVIKSVTLKRVKEIIKEFVEEYGIANEDTPCS